MNKDLRTLSMEYRPLRALIPYARNARTHSDTQVAEIAASIREFGFTNPILVDGENGIIAGHGRLLAARKLGMTDVPVIELAGMTEAQKRAYVIADNRLALNAGWNTELLALEFSDLASLGFDLSLTGFGEDEIAALLNSGNPGLTDPDDIPDLAEKPVTQPGDLWVLGKHRLICGDSTNATEVERVLAGVRPHLMVTDPPYGVSYDAAWRQRAGVGSGELATGRVAERRSCRLARGMGALSRRRRLCLARGSPYGDGGGESGELRLRGAGADRLGQDAAGDWPRRLPLAARARLVRRPQGQPRALGRRTQPDDRLGDPPPQVGERAFHREAGRMHEAPDREQFLAGPSGL
jgi:hypothetical protein